ncbi:MAG: hypothetical protein AABX30_02050 [Nanoarchaeota archaeon]
MANPRLVKFIKEARGRGFDDFQIREPLLRYGWSEEEVDSAFESLKPRFKSKNEVKIFLSDELMAKIQKRADKNMLTLHEQVEDILRRSSLNMRKRTPAEEKVDDKFITLFSRKK